MLLWPPEGGTLQLSSSPQSSREEYRSVTSSFSDFICVPFKGEQKAIAEKGLRVEGLLGVTGCLVLTEY